MAERHNRKHRGLMVVLLIIGVIIISLLAYAALVFTSVNRFALQWETQNQQPLASDSIQLVVLGDSTMQGIGSTSTRYGVAGQVAAGLSKEQGKPVQIYNYSKSGAVASDVLDTQLPAATQLADADVVMLAVGPNDMVRNVAKDEYLQTYTQILEKLPRDKLVIASIPPLVRSKVHGESVKEWNIDLLALASRNKVRVAPVYDRIQPRRYDPLIYSIDLFHPSNIGYAVWAGAFHDPVQQIVSDQ